MKLVIVNPLGAALAYYTEVLEETLGDEGEICVSVINVMEPSSRSGWRKWQRIRWIAETARSYSRARRLAGRDGSVILTWPVLGLWDAVFASLLVRRLFVVVHDPQPLVAAVGYGATARLLLRHLFRGTILVHSSAAFGTVQVWTHRVKIVGHPVRVRARDLSDLSDESRPRLLVLGQYKVDRDLRLLEDLAPHFEGWDLRIVGRGWPSVKGWQVDNVFLSERDFDYAVSSAAAILIPYSRFFQSGVALRAYEFGVPAVALRDSVVAELYENPDRSLPRSMRPDEWVRCVHEVTKFPALRPIASYRDAVVTSWRQEVRAAITSTQLVVAGLGPLTEQERSGWLRFDEVHGVRFLQSASADGSRFGSRLLGIGCDSLLLALRLRFSRGARSFRYLALNPWLGAALRITGLRVAVTGVYAEPGGRSFRALRRGLLDSPVIAFSNAEVQAWRHAGGSAYKVAYGNTFAYPIRTVTGGAFRVFVGGSSDRDPNLLNKLVMAAQHRTDLQFVFALGAKNDAFDSLANVTQHGRLPQVEFGKLMASCDVAFLPLSSRARSSGQMVCVAALQLGIPVVATPVPGISDYLDGHFVRPASEALEPLLNQLVDTANWGRSAVSEIQDYWAATFSRECLQREVVNALIRSRFIA